MRDRTIPRARQAPVADEPLTDDARYDYADAFEIEVRTQEMRSAEELVRLAIEEAPAVIRRTILTAHRHLLRFRLGPASSPGHIMGWNIVRSEPDVVQIETVGPVARAVIVARKPAPNRMRVSTFVFYVRPAIGRLLLKLAGPVHRRIAPYLLERTAAALDKQDGLSTTAPT